MTGETNLPRLLAAMEPTLDPETYVFATLAPGTSSPCPTWLTAEEAEGTTLIVTQQNAETHNIDHTFPSRRITLKIHSSLEAVGFLAALLPPLAAAGIGVNPVSAYYHDHLFVPVDRAEDAFTILRDIAASHAAHP